MDWWVASLIVGLPLIGLLAIGVPIAFSLGLISITALVVLLGPETLSVLRYLPYSTIANFLFAPAPLFILMAELLIISGVSRDLYDTIYEWIGSIPGGLAVATVVTGALIGAMCGISAAAVAILAVFSVPEFERFRYRRTVAAGCITATGALSILIPPSLPLILYGCMAEESIGDLFMAGLGPGIFLAALFIVWILIDGIWHRTSYLKPSSIDWRLKLMHLIKIGPALAIIFVVLGTIYLGIATPTESAGCGCIAVVILSLLRKRLKWSNLREAVQRSAVTTCMLFFVAVGAMLFGHTLTLLHIPQNISLSVAALEVPPWLVLVMMQVLLFILGCFLDIVSIVLLTSPILAPIATSLGYDGVWFGVLIMVNMEMALLTPPVGLNLWVFQSIGEKYGFTLRDTLNGIIPYLVMDGLTIVVMMVFPQLALWLPSVLK
jgi:C4-dicarboxylate transporter DctM subunit